MSKTFACLAVAAVAVLASAPAFATVTATLDRDVVTPGETVQLTLERDSNGSGKPDLAPLERDFDVMGTSTGRSVQFVNGAISARVQVQLTLAPKHTGIITIPALRWNGEQSAPVQLRVADAGGGSGRGGDAGNPAAARTPHVFLTAELDDAQPYVLAPAVLTVRLHTDVAVYQASLELPANADVVAQPLGKDRQLTESREGRQFQVVERRFLLFPQKSGTLSLEGPVLDAQVAQADNDLFGGDPLFGRTFGQMLQRARPLRLHGDPIELQVRPRPPEWRGNDWLPARRVTIEETWQPGDAQVKAGEPLTRHLTLKVQGQTASQLPDLGAAMQLPDGLRAYPDQPKLDSGLDGDAVVATREQDIALIAGKAGRYVLPEVRVPWWDTAANQARVAVLPARTLEVLPAAGGAASPGSDAPVVSLSPSTSAPSAAPATPPASTIASDPWRWVSLGLGILWIATLGGWITSRRTRRSVPAATAADTVDERSARAAFSDLRRACGTHDAPRARRDVLAWGRATWPQDPPVGLREVARRLGDDALARLLEELDRACYAGAAWNGDALARAFPARTPAVQGKARGSALAPLYP